MVSSLLKLLKVKNAGQYFSEKTCRGMRTKEDGEAERERMMRRLRERWKDGNVAT